MNKNLQYSFEQIIASPRFQMSLLYEQVWTHIEQYPIIADYIPHVQTLGETLYKKIAEALIRNIFLIELVKQPKIETTKMQVRWCNELRSDPRGCSFAECLEILQGLLIKLPNWLQANSLNNEVLQLCLTRNLIPYEAPIDYVKRTT